MCPSGGAAARSPFRSALHGLIAAEFTRARRPCLAIGLGVTAAVVPPFRPISVRSSDTAVLRAIALMLKPFQEILNCLLTMLKRNQHN